MAENGDGRRERRERNRDAVIEAVLEIIAGGDLEPTVADVAARAGVSARSIFRYFDDIDDLCRAGLARQRERIDPILLRELDVTADDPPDARVAAVVDQRVELFETMGHVGEFARHRAPFQPLIADQLTFARAVLRDRLARACEPELADLPPEQRDAIVAAADVMCSFEAYRLLRRDHNRSREDAARVLRTALLSLVTAGVVAR